MKYFKTKPSRNAKRYEITPEVFEKVTGHKHPFEQVNLDKKLVQYGICPSCLNPVRLIGLAKEIKVRPYGKHTGKNIPGLPQWRQYKYRYCPFAEHGDRVNINDDELLPEITEDVVELYELLKSQFDRVVYVVSKELDIRCSSVFWEEALKQFIANMAYCYPWLTESNLPYIFAYRGMQHRSLYGQKILVDSDLFNAMKNHKDASFVESQNKKGQYLRLTNKEGAYLNIQCRFTEHRQKAINGEELRESMVFCIDDLPSGRTIFRKSISFSENYFMNIINKYSDESKRQQVLFDIANRNMPPLL